MSEVCSRKEIELVAVGFILSVIHWTLCLVYFACLLFFFYQGVKGCIKGLLILTTRGILSTAVSCSLTEIVQMEKFALIFIFSLYILKEQRRYRKTKQIFNIEFLVSLFAVYNIVASMLNSSYPVVAAFKVISYAIPFLAVLVGVSVTNKEIDWSDYLNYLLTPVILLSFVTVPFDRFRIVNLDFQGAINHPNLFGIFGALYIGNLLYNMSQHKKRFYGVDILLIGISFLMVYLSASRTGMFSAVIMLLIFILTQVGESKVKTILGLIIVLCAVSVYFSMNQDAYAEVVDQITEFVYKRNTEDIFESRSGQIDASQEKYEAHQMLGSGFAVPYDEEVRDYKFSLSMTYEAGNLVYAVLGDCGMIGSMIFWGYMLYILVFTKIKKWVLFFLPIVISLGEMAFFSTNNIAIYYYLFYGICMGTDKEERIKG